MAKQKYYILPSQEIAELFSNAGASVIAIGDNPYCIAEEAYDSIAWDIIDVIYMNDDDSDDYIAETLEAGLSYLYWSTEKIVD